MTTSLACHSTRRYAARVWLLLSVLLSCVPGASAEPADRVIAVVNGELVLLSEVDLQKAVTAHDPDASRFWTRPVRTEVLRVTDAAVVRASAGDVSLYAPTTAEVRERVASIRGSFDSAAEADTWALAWGLDADRLEERVIQRLIVEKYLSRNLAVPEDNAEWDAEADALLGALRTTRRIRRIGPQR